MSCYHCSYYTEGETKATGENPANQRRAGELSLLLVPKPIKFSLYPTSLEVEGGVGFGQAGVSVDMNIPPKWLDFSVVKE